MSDEDEFLVAWLKARDYVIVEDNFTNVFLRKNHVTAFKSYDVGLKHISMWITPRHINEWSIQLHRTQGKGRRPLRGLLREWVLGL